MSLTAATLIPGLILLLLGLPLLAAGPTVSASLRAFPRSKSASLVFFGAGAAWFLYHIWNLSTADFGDYRIPLFIGFTLIAILAFKCVPDFLAVRGVCILGLLGAMPLLDAAYMQYTHPQRLWMVSLVYLVIVLSLWIGAQPWRLRDFFGWLLARPGRPRYLGGLLAAYGLLLAFVAFTY
jgi:hypothetical protein